MFTSEFCQQEDEQTHLNIWKWYLKNVTILILTLCKLSIFVSKEIFQKQLQN